MQHLRLVGCNPSNGSDDLWARLCDEARLAHSRTPGLAALFCGTITEQPSLEVALFNRVAARLKNDVVSRQDIIRAFHRALRGDVEFGNAVHSDIRTELVRTSRHGLLALFLYSNRLHAKTVRRLTDWLSRTDEMDLALFLGCCASDIWDTDLRQAVEPGAHEPARMN